MACPLLKVCPEKVDYDKYKRVCLLCPNKCETWKTFRKEQKLLPREWMELLEEYTESWLVKKEG